MDLIDLITVAGACLNQTPLSFEHNKIILYAPLTRLNKKCDLLCLPELCISGYGCEDAFHSLAVAEKSLDSLIEIAPHTENIAVGIGLPIIFKNALYNAVAMVANKNILGFALKKTLAGSDLYYENRWFSAYNSTQNDTLKIDNYNVPIGDLMFDLNGVNIGFEICEEAWSVSRQATALGSQGVDIILNPSASHFAFEQYNKRKNIASEGARANNCTYVYANLLGLEAGRIIYDGTVLIATADKGIVKEGSRFEFEDTVLTTHTVSVQKSRLLKRKMNSVNNVNAPNKLMVVSSAIKNWPNKVELNLNEPTENNAHYNKFEEFTYAVSLGLWDYLIKSKNNCYVVSLSGGADSATVTTLIYIMLKRAYLKLTDKQIAFKLAHIIKSEKAPKFEVLINQLLICVYQQSKFSSTTTRNAAKKLSNNIGAKYFEFKIDELVDKYLTLGKTVLGRDLNWENNDIALQNIQARVRGPSVWLIANLFNGLLLSTSNRSEAAVGYATMDGDTCGGLCPIGGIDKDFILKWLSFIEHGKLDFIGPLKILSLITSQKPTAELRPLNLKQNDETDLMPYNLLDTIERLAIRDRKFPLQVWDDLCKGIYKQEQYTKKQLADYVCKFFRLWSTNQWKRERYAPSFHLDDENLDPKTWCRFPILSGGFKEDLQKLQEISA